MDPDWRPTANVARSDVQVMLDLAAEIPIGPEIPEHPLEEPSTALHETQNAQCPRGEGSARWLTNITTGRRSI